MRLGGQRFSDYEKGSNFSIASMLPLSARYAYVAKELFTQKTESGIRYSIREIVGESGKSYGEGVYLDSEMLSELTDSERAEMVKEYVKELGGKIFSAFDANGKEVSFKVIEGSKHYRNQAGKSVPANKELAHKFIKNKTKQEAIALIDELVITSKHSNDVKAAYSHDWVDNYGKSDWEYWKTYIQDKEKTVWEATLNVTTTANGEKILYDIF